MKTILSAVAEETHGSLVKNSRGTKKKKINHETIKKIQNITDYKHTYSV